MKIIGFGLTRIEAKKLDNIKDDLKINTNVEIKEIVKEEIESLKDFYPLKISFSFSVNYLENIGYVNIDGYLVISTDKKEFKEILKDWEDKKIEDSIKLIILNFIITKVSLKALQLEEELNLPYHIPFPRIKKQKE
ncbi:MAG: hypothetical protein QW117_01225 [Candidatus Pacearchaeota archaeon]